MLGGAGKTPVAIEYARQLAKGGCRVALVGHAFRAAASHPQIVCCHDSVSQVGDDALVAARALEPFDVQVWVGKDRGRTIMAAARSAQVIVVDGLLQTRPQPLARSVLVLDATRPFGSGQCPPAGDLRAPVEALIAHCNEIVLVSDSLDTSRSGAESALALPAGVFRRTAHIDIGGAQGCNHRLSLEELQGLRLGLMTLVAHPERIESSVTRRAIRPVCIWFGADHGPMRGRSEGRLRTIAQRNALDAWLVTPKCVTHLRNRDVGCEVLVLDVSTRLDPDPRPVLDCRPCVPRES